MLSSSNINRFPRQVQLHQMCPWRIKQRCPLQKMQEGAFQLGLFQFCHQSVKECYGCGQLLKMQQDGHWHIPPAPNDLVIIMAMRRPYWQNGVQRLGSPSKVHFHCHVKCVRAMQAALLPFLVIIPTVRCPHLLPVYNQQLAQELEMAI